ncbi:TrgA family protein [Neotabrizicola sp. VNH66]|uniref:TrgA family protein n=1 Tax=Neotabrizicola sp. VNH66 TaxID=3400918 RepID=UPI003BFE5E47
MPTSAKLAAALWFAAMGWLAANAHVPALGPDAQIGWFREITAAIGLVCGWTISGRLAGGTWTDAVNNGLRTTVSMAVLALLGFSIMFMVKESLRMRYDGPMDAVVGVFTLMIEHAQKMLSVGVIGVLLIAALGGGLLTEAVFRRWR